MCAGVFLVAVLITILRGTGLWGVMVGSVGFVVVFGVSFLVAKLMLDADARPAGTNARDERPGEL